MLSEYNQNNQGKSYIRLCLTRADDNQPVFVFETGSSATANDFVAAKEKLSITGATIDVDIGYYFPDLQDTFYAATPIPITGSTSKFSVTPIRYQDSPEIYRRLLDSPVSIRFRNGTKLSQRGAIVSNFQISGDGEQGHLSFLCISGNEYWRAERNTMLGNAGYRLRNPHLANVDAPIWLKGIKYEDKNIPGFCICRSTRPDTHQALEDLKGVILAFDGCNNQGQLVFQFALAESRQYVGKPIFFEKDQFADYQTADSIFANKLRAEYQTNIRQSRALSYERLVQKYDSTTSSFQNKIANALNRISPITLTRLADFGWKLHAQATHNEGGDFPKKFTPTKADPRELANQVSGSYQSWKKKAIVAMQYLTSAKSSELVSVPDIAHVTVHETMHGVNHLIGERHGNPGNYLSNSKGFIKAYNADIAKMDPATKKRLLYFIHPKDDDSKLTPTRRGRSEALTEALTVLHLGIRSAFASDFYKHFPEVLKFAKREYNRYFGLEGKLALKTDFKGFSAYEQQLIAQEKARAKRKQTVVPNYTPPPVFRRQIVNHYRNRRTTGMNGGYSGGRYNTSPFRGSTRRSTRDSSRRNLPPGARVYKPSPFGGFQEEW